MRWKFSRSTFSSCSHLTMTVHIGTLIGGRRPRPESERTRCGVAVLPIPAGPGCRKVHVSEMGRLALSEMLRGRRVHQACTSKRVACASTPASTPQHRYGALRFSKLMISADRNACTLAVARLHLPAPWWLVPRPWLGNNQ